MSAEVFSGATSPLTVRQHARNHGALDGADAQALEHALTITERERDNLLARIHRDGGHHTDAVGLVQSLADAHKKVADTYGEVSQLKTVIKEMLTEYDKFGVRGADVEKHNTNILLLLDTLRSAV